MATAAANWVFQRNPLLFQLKPTRFRPLRPLVPAQIPVLLKLNATAKSIQYRQPIVKQLDLKTSVAANSKCVWKFGVKVTAGVVLGLLFLMNRPKAALAGSLGRVRASCVPLDPSYEDLESDKRYRAARDYSFAHSMWDTLGITSVPYGLYYGALVVLFILCRWLKFFNPSMFIWYERQVKYLAFLLLAHMTWAARNNPCTAVKLQIQVNLSNDGRALQTDLNRIAETTANASTYKAVNSILTETALTILKHPDCFISANIYVAEKYGRDGAQKFLDELSLEERIRLGEQPLVNVKNLKAGSSTSQESPNDIQDEHIEVDDVDPNQLDIKAESPTSQKSANDIQDDLMEVIILVAVVAKHDEFPRIKSWDDLKEVMQLLTSVKPEDGIYPYVVEVLWRPKSSTGRRRWWFR